VSERITKYNNNNNNNNNNAAVAVTGDTGKPGGDDKPQRKRWCIPDAPRGIECCVASNIRRAATSERESDPPHHTNLDQ
jgi:hypothetical protein